MKDACSGALIFLVVVRWVEDVDDMQYLQYCTCLFSSKMNIN